MNMNPKILIKMRIDIRREKKEMAPSSKSISWRSPRTEEPGVLQSMGLQRVRHDRAYIHHIPDKLQQLPDGQQFWSLEKVTR